MNTQYDPWLPVKNDTWRTACAFYNLSQQPRAIQDAIREALDSNVAIKGWRLLSQHEHAAGIETPTDHDCGPWDAATIQVIRSRIQKTDPRDVRAIIMEWLKDDL